VDPALQKDSRSRNTHASTAIEGNPLTLEQVRALEQGRSIAAPILCANREGVIFRLLRNRRAPLPHIGRLFESAGELKRSKSWR
jgi:hypothetical protein